MMEKMKEKIGKGVVKVMSKMPGMKKGMMAVKAIRKMGPMDDSEMSKAMVSGVAKKAMKRGSSNGYMVR